MKTDLLDERERDALLDAFPRLCLFADFTRKGTRFTLNATGRAKVEAARATQPSLFASGDDDPRDSAFLPISE